jgi:hypothetical protein
MGEPPPHIETARERSTPLGRRHPVLVESAKIQGNERAIIFRPAERECRPWRT